jgi:hypothetical protein
VSASHLILSRCSFVTDAARIVIDTSQPTIVPPPTVVEDAAQSKLSLPLQSYASAVLPATVAHVDQKRRKITKRQEPKVAAYRPY